MMKLDTALQSVTLLGFDTAPIIYFVEANPRYDALVTEIVQRIIDSKLAGMTSVVTLLEVLVIPLRSSDLVLQQEYRALLLNSGSFFCSEITAAVAETAANLRAYYNLRTPDALQMASAIEAGCQAFLINDASLKRVNEITVLTLDELEL